MIISGRSGDPAYEPRAESRGPIERAAIDRVAPQTSSTRIDLTARLNTQLHEGVGDGWRFATLPPDAEAYRAWRSTLGDSHLQAHARAFTQLEGPTQDALLERAAAGKLEPEPRKALQRFEQETYPDENGK